MTQHSYTDSALEPLARKLCELDGWSPSATGSFGVKIIREGRLTDTGHDTRKGKVEDVEAPPMWTMYVHKARKLQAFLDGAPAQVACHDATYLRGWNEGIERAAELLDEEGSGTPAEKIRALLEAPGDHGGAPAQESQQPRWRHKKRGTAYIEVGRGNLQIATDPVEEDDRVVVYRSEADGRLWVRGEAEFQDGRFEALSLTSTERRCTCEFTTDDLGAPTIKICPVCAVPHPDREASK